MSVLAVERNAKRFAGGGVGGRYSVLSRHMFRVLFRPPISFLSFSGADKIYYLKYSSGLGFIVKLPGHGARAHIDLTCSSKSLLSPPAPRRPGVKFSTRGVCNLGHIFHVKVIPNNHLTVNYKFSVGSAMNDVDLRMTAKRPGLRR